jgi:hypothetical protein
MSATPFLESGEALRQRLPLADRLSKRSAILIVAFTNVVLWSGIGAVIWRFW